MHKNNILSQNFAKLSVKNSIFQRMLKKFIYFQFKCPAVPTKNCPSSQICGHYNKNSVEGNEENEELFGSKKVT